ncbi:response regulator [Candidatus Saccharibacteria bacterium]|nr:response regulator [Candidatus Saccharibacteria bacterium]
MDDSYTQPEVTETPQSEAPSTPVGTGKKVLCIEDEHFISELYERALTKAGYQVNTVVDGIAGLAEAQTDRYDIILLDIMLPNMSGLEILHELRDGGKTPDLKAKIIITTNLDQGEEGRASVETKADGYVVKAEATPKQLVEFLQQLAV